MGRPTNRDARRAQIVEGLLRVLPEAGYERATVARIAQAAGLGAGLVHHHFASKQEILLALGERLAAGIEARLRPAEPARGRLEAWIDAHLALGEGASPEAVACWVALGAEALSQPEVGDLYRALVARRLDALRGLLREVCREEQRATGGLDLLAATILAAIEGFYQLASAAPETVPRGHAARAVRELAHRALDARPAIQPAKPRTKPQASKPSRSKTKLIQQSTKARSTKTRPRTTKGGPS
ncbi:MAG: TetR family transcriptional regulator C-terminal domain-containing protein [Myxococcales bacterium]|nr:TetR family transcriptional regulator C-terminal domain-containing protein [Myxococcales bacterium]